MTPGEGAVLIAAGGRGRKRSVALIVAVGLGLLGLALYGALLIALPVFQFPQPGGQYGIGTLTYHWVDTNRAEAFSGDTSARRELMVQSYIVVALDQPYTAATVVFPDGREVGALPLPQMMPLIHQSYSPAAIPPTLNGHRLEQGIVPYLAQDVSFTLKQLTVLNQADPKAVLTGRLDLVNVGVFGVSLGGIVGAEACLQEPRLKACLFMDAPMPVDVVKSGLPQSAMWITRDAETMRLERRRSGGWLEAEIIEHLTSMRAVFSSMQGNGYFVQVPGMFHINLTDIPNWSPVLRWLRVIGPIDAQRAHDITNAYSLAFFNRHLLGRAEVLLGGPASQYPDVLFDSRQP